MANIVHTKECVERRNGKKSDWIAGCPRCDFNIEQAYLRANPAPITIPGFKEFMHGMSIYFSDNKEGYEIEIFQGSRKDKV